MFRQNKKNKKLTSHSTQKEVFLISLNIIITSVHSHAKHICKICFYTSIMVKKYKLNLEKLKNKFF